MVSTTGLSCLAPAIVGDGGTEERAREESSDLLSLSFEDDSDDDLEPFFRKIDEMPMLMRQRER